MITRTTILIRCVTDEDDTLTATVDAIEKVLDLATDTFLVRSETDGHDVSIEIDFDGDVAVAPYIEVLTSFLPFMVDNVVFDLRFMNKDRYEVRDQNGDVLHSSEVYGHATVLFRSWMGNDPDESLSGAGIFDNYLNKWSIRLSFDNDEPSFDWE
jgi:hypothetical protein